MLAIQCCVQIGALQVVRRLLYKMPVLSPDSSSTQFFRVWSQWQNTCRQLLEVRQLRRRF